MDLRAAHTPPASTRNRKLISITKESDPEKPEVLFRLGQLFEEGARYWSFRARELDQQIFEARAQRTDT